MSDLYSNIRNRRKELGMTQTELAERVGYSDKSMISKIEKGHVDLNLSNILEIADILQIDPAVLCGWK